MKKVMIVEDDLPKKIAMDEAIKKIAPGAKIFDRTDLESAKTCLDMQSDLDFILLDWDFPLNTSNERAAGPSGLEFLKYMQQTGRSVSTVICSTAVVEVTDDAVFGPVVGSIWALPYDSLAERISATL